MGMMKDYIFAGFFCSKCYNIIDGNLNGNPRVCLNCFNQKREVTTPRKKIIK